MNNKNIIPDTETSLFWYPELKYKYDFDKGIDKPLLMRSYICYYLARCQSMFKWNNLPDTIPAKWLENYLITDGYCCVINTSDGLFATNCGIGSDPDEYYIPKTIIVTNPWLPEESSGGRQYTRDVDTVLVRNDTYTQGLMPLIIRYCSALVENDISMNIADITARASVALTAMDDQTKASAEQWLNNLIKGKVGIIGSTPFIVDENIKAIPIGQIAGTLTDLIEYHQYLKAGLFNELGLNSNYNMKRESINSNESQLNDDMLHPFIDEMLACRKEAAEQINKMFGTDISVEFNSAWADNEKENALMMEQAEQTVEQSDEVSEDAPVEDETVDETVEDETVEDAPVTDEIIEQVADEIIETVEQKLNEVEKDGDTDV